MVVHFGDRDIFNQKEGELMAKEINWNVVLVVLVIGVVGILLLSNSGILTGAVIDATNSAGTTGKIAKWTSSSKLGNSVITESAGKVGIGTSILTDKLSVKGFISSQIADGATYTDIVTYDSTGTKRLAVIRSLSANKNLEIWTPNGGDISLIPGPGGNVLVSSNVGIGTISPGAKLDINAGTSTPLLLQTSSQLPWAITLRRTDLGAAKDVNLFNNNGEFYVENKAHFTEGILAGASTIGGVSLTNGQINTNGEAKFGAAKITSDLRIGENFGASTTVFPLWLDERAVLSNVYINDLGFVLVINPLKVYDYVSDNDNAKTMVAAGKIVYSDQRFDAVHITSPVGIYGKLQLGEELVLDDLRGDKIGFVCVSAEGNIFRSAILCSLHNI